MPKVNLSKESLEEIKALIEEQDETSDDCEFSDDAYKIVRCEDSGVFAGYLESRDGREVVLRKARRLWFWSGAATLSQLAEEGVKNLSECKFPQEVNKILLLDVIEISDCTQKAKRSIAKVEAWKE